MSHIPVSLLLCMLKFSIMKIFNEGVKLVHLLIFHPVLNFRVL